MKENKNSTIFRIVFYRVITIIVTLYIITLLVAFMIDFSLLIEAVVMGLKASVILVALVIVFYVTTCMLDISKFLFVRPRERHYVVVGDSAQYQYRTPIIARELSRKRVKKLTFPRSCFVLPRLTVSRITKNKAIYSLPEIYSREGLVALSIKKRLDCANKRKIIPP